MRRYALAVLDALLPPDPPGSAAPLRVSNVVQLAPGGMPRGFAGLNLPDMNAAAQAGLTRYGFEALTPAKMNEMLAAIAAFPPFAALADAGRVEWLPLFWGFRHAEYLGATKGRHIGFKWSAEGQTYNEAENVQAWASWLLGRTGVGSLIATARRLGFDTAPWLHPTAPLPAPLPALPPSGFMQRLPMGATNLHRVPWLMDGVLVTGDLTVLAGQGGGAKTALAIVLCVAIAAGHQAWGPFGIMPRADGAPRRVLYMSGEEDANRLGLLVAAACAVLELDAADRAAVAANLMLHDARASGWRLGRPKPAAREAIAPDWDDTALAALRDALAATPVDLVVLDTVAGLFALPNENDNNAVTDLMGRLARVLRETDTAGLLIHHTPKMTREAAAALRGEAAIVRGGSGFVNSARVVLTLTGLPLQEAAAAAMAGMKPDTVRRLETVKINDRAPPAPAYLEVVGEMVAVSDGTRQSIRAVRFIPSPPDLASAGGLPTATLNVAMRTIDAGVVVNGVRAPLSPGGGRSNNRDAKQHVARALRAASPGLPEAHAATIAKQAIGYLLDKLGCIEVHDVVLPQQAKGKANGRKTAKALVCRWDLATWTVTPPAPAAPDARAPEA